jgi:hypothetical protein
MNDTADMQEGWNVVSADDHGDEVQILVHGGVTVAKLEDFGYAAYPCAINAATGNLERGGAYHDRIAAKAWAERVAGMHPAQPGDERPPFYWTQKE